MQTSTLLATRRGFLSGAGGLAAGERRPPSRNERDRLPRSGLLALAISVVRRLLTCAVPLQ
jgi:hypothetical protein